MGEHRTEHEATSRPAPADKSFSKAFRFPFSLVATGDWKALASKPANISIMFEKLIFGHQSKYHVLDALNLPQSQYHKNRLHDPVFFTLLLLRYNETTFDSLMIHAHHIPTRVVYIYDMSFLTMDMLKRQYGYYDGSIVFEPPKKPVYEPRPGRVRSGQRYSFDDRGLLI